MLEFKMDGTISSVISLKNCWVANVCHWSARGYIHRRSFVIQNGIVREMAKKGVVHNALKVYHINSRSGKRRLVDDDGNFVKKEEDAAELSFPSKRYCATPMYANLESPTLKHCSSGYEYNVSLYFIVCVAAGLNENKGVIFVDAESKKLKVIKFDPPYYNVKTSQDGSTFFLYRNDQNVSEVLILDNPLLD